jgi:glucokinase
MDSAVEVVLAVDIGGTKVAAGLVTLEGDLLLADRAPTDRNDPWPGLEALVRSVLAEARAGGRRRGVRRPDAARR